MELSVSKAQDPLPLERLSIHGDLLDGGLNREVSFLRREDRNYRIFMSVSFALPLRVPFAVDRRGSTLQTAYFNSTPLCLVPGRVLAKVKSFHGICRFDGYD
jgi:hypothetical protein